MAHNKSVLYLLLITSITACSIEEKPHYLLKDTSLITYQGGDSLSYSILDASANDDRTGIYKITLLNKDEIEPNTNIANLLFEEQVESGNFTTPFLPQYFSQNNQGDLILKAIGNSGDILWLLDSDDTQTGETLYPSDISSMVATNSFTKKLQRCDENNDCVDAGQYKLLELEFTGIETATTPYADFEAYAINISTELNIFDIEQAGNSKSYLLSGTQWIYPQLGVVKFVYEVNNFTGISTLIGTLSNTNISIPETHKK